MAKIFHHTDPDGYCAAAIVYQQEGGELIAMNYPADFPFDSIQENEKVYIVDYSIDPKDMKKLLKITPNVIWIDHHKTAIDKYSDFPEKIEGLRVDGKSGCVLTWEYLHSGTKVPMSVTYIGDYDTWQFKHKGTKDFFMGLQTLRLSDPKSKVWSEILSDEINDELIEKGKIVTKFRDQWASDYRSKYGFETTLEGHSAFAMNLGSCGSDYFGDLIDKYDMLISFCFNGDIWNLSFYSNKIDVSEVAIKYGGGGHTGASGVSVKELPFKAIKIKKLSCRHYD